jgi:hypothetical protein
MGEASDRLRFTQQALLGGLRRRPTPSPLAEELESDPSIEARIERRVNLAHPAPANQAQDEVTTYIGASDQLSLLRKRVSQRLRRERLWGAAGAGGNQVCAGRATGQVAFGVGAFAFVKAPVNERKD